MLRRVPATSQNVRPKTIPKQSILTRKDNFPFHSNFNNRAPEVPSLFKISISFTKSCAKAVSQRQLLYVCTVPPCRLSFHNQMQIHDGLLITPLLTPARGEQNIHLSLGSKAAADQTCIFIRGHHLGMPGITGDCQSRCFQNTYSTAHQASFWTKSDRRKSSCTWEPSRHMPKTWQNREAACLLKVI